MSALAHSASDRAPQAPLVMADQGARGGHDEPLLQMPARVSALSARCDRLIRMIADCQRHHERRARLTRELIRARTQQLRAELRWEKQQRKKLS